MRLFPLKSSDELLREYESRNTLRIPGAVLLLAFYVGFVALVGGIVRYSLTDSDGSTGTSTYQGVGPHSDAGDNEP